MDITKPEEFSKELHEGSHDYITGWNECVGSFAHHIALFLADRAPAAAPAPLPENHEWHAMVERIRQRHAWRYEGISTPNEARMSDIDHLLKYIDRQASKPTAPAPVAAIKTWQERCDWWSERSSTKLMVEAMKAEIADLRAALAAVPAAAPIVQPVGKPWTAGEALRYAAKVIELYDDATMQGDYMLSSTDCAGILAALAEMPMFAAAAPSVQAEPVAIVDEGDDGMFAEILPDRSVKVGQYLYAGAAPTTSTADAKDAARYQFLRQRTVAWNALLRPVWRSGEALDAAIDAAIATSADEAKS